MPKACDPMICYNVIIFGFPISSQYEILFVSRGTYKKGKEENIKEGV